MTERKERLLCAIVEKYIETGEPIGSKALVESLGMSVSSATVRNEMSDLVSMGYLEQPHTSAGRIPSSAGYRYYVDRLMNKYELSQNEKRVIETQLFKVSGEPQKILEQAGNILAEITNCAAVSTTPSDESAVIRRIELVPIGTKTAMVVILTSSGLLKSKVCRTEAEITLDMVESFYNMTMTHFIGKNVSNMNIAKIQTLAVSLGEKFFVMTPLLVTLCDLAEMTERTELLLEGQSNLLNHKEFESNAYEIMEFLRRSEPLNQIFTKNVEQKSDKFSPNVLIGKENLFRELQNSSMIFSKYFIGGRESGTLGIIGPTRIDYARLIPSLKFLTDIVGTILSDNIDE
ncbi:MAG: heat-inducible transcriptional repressor HrcA [Oscillospiraceae bacterium]